MCITYGYCRISQEKQNIDRQLRNINAAYPDAKIIKETYTGKSIERKEWTKLFKKAQKGDTIIFDSVSRMSRNAEEGVKAYEELFLRGVELIFLKEPHINTEIYKTAAKKTIPLTGTSIDYILEGINNFLLVLAKEQVIIAFNQAEKEVADIQQRTKEGIAIAKLKGKRIGRQKGDKLTTKKSISAKVIIAKHSKTFGGTLDDDDVRKLAGISRNTYYKYKSELKKAAVDE